MPSGKNARSFLSPRSRKVFAGKKLNQSSIFGTSSGNERDGCDGNVSSGPPRSNTASAAFNKPDSDETGELSREAKSTGHSILSKTRVEGGNQDGREEDRGEDDFISKRSGPQKSVRSSSSLGVFKGSNIPVHEIEVSKESPWGTNEADRGPTKPGDITPSGRARAKQMMIPFARLSSKIPAASSHSKLPPGGSTAKVSGSKDKPDEPDEGSDSQGSEGSSLNSDDMEQAGDFERRVSLVHDPFIEYSANAKKSFAEKIREKREKKKAQEAENNKAAVERLRLAQNLEAETTAAQASITSGAARTD